MFCERVRFSETVKRKSRVGVRLILFHCAHLALPFFILAQAVFEVDKSFIVLSPLSQANDLKACCLASKFSLNSHCKLKMG
jgi:hypothetical protein